MTSSDDNFPRGGLKTSAKLDPCLKKAPRQENLFGNTQIKKKSKGKKKRQNLQEDVESATSVPEFINITEELAATSADTLSYKKIHEGMTVLASVKRLNTMNVEVELPGRCFGEILVQNISTQHTKIVSESVKEGGSDLPSLNTVLELGTSIPVKVLQIDNGDKLRVFVSCNPSDVNEHFKHADFTKNMLVWGSVKEKSDHGYLIDLGVKNARAYLPFDAIDDDKEYNDGKVLYMTVSKSVSSQEATTLTLDSTKLSIDKTVESMGTSLDKVLPGMQIEFLVQKILKDGLQGQYFDECTGFINDLYLQEPFESVKKYKEFALFRTRLLYVHPVSKLGYFTLKPFQETLPETKLSVGLWMHCTVMARAGSGLVVKLDGGYKGFITHKRLMQTLKNREKDQDDVSSIIANKFPVGTHKHCTILDYYHTERMYICTFEQINEVMNMEQLKVAQVVKGTIKTINNHGIVVRIGRIEAFAPKDNLSNVRYSENIRKQFKVGQEITAKVWNINIDKRDVILTLKPDLLSSDVHLTSYDDLSYTTQYPGVVITINETGVLLLFYGGVKGWLPTRSIPQLGGKDARNEFYQGQIVKVRIASCEESKLTLTLNTPVKKRVAIGKIVSKPVISKIDDDGLYVMVGETETLLPKEQLAVEGIGKLLSATYKVNDVLLEEIVCVATTTPPIMSVREYIVQKREDLKIPTLHDCLTNVVMRAIYQGESTMHVPTKLKSTSFKIEDKMLRMVNKYETICAKVEKRLGKGRILWNVRLNNVFNFSYVETFNYLDQFLSDLQRLKKRYKQVGNALGDLEVGNTVDCVINKVDLHRGCSVFVQPMNCQGLVSLNHCSGKLKEGSTVEGKVLWINYELKYAAITLNPKVMSNINDVQDNKIDLQVLRQQIGKLSVEVLYANRNVAVGVLRKKYNRQIVYMPVKLHENDVFPKIDYYDSLVGTEIKVKMNKMKSGKLLAIPITMAEFMRSKMKKCGEIKILRNKVIKTVPDIKEEKVKKIKTGNDVKVETKEEDEGIESADDIVDAKSENESEPEESVMEVEEFKGKKKRKLQEAASTIKKVKTVEECEPALVLLPGMSSFFDEEAPLIPKEESDDEDASEPPKKKLTAAERLQKAKDEEDRLRKIETDLADASVLPQNAEQFDRALLGNPDDSELWTRYIAFHVQSTEFEKARTVCKRAIERISYTALQDRLNVWLAYLNLENMYGTKESFDAAFEEAARCNDSMTIYLEAIKMLAEMSKFPEMEVKIKKAKGKFKQELQMWLEIGKVYYKCGKFAEARKFKDSGLLTLIDKKSHIQLIVQNAIMEFAHGESSHGEALLEAIVQADPRRVDIWCTYADQLIKKGKIDLARNVLSRAVGQKLPYKKMRTLFKKYHSYEKTYGDDKTLAHVTNLLTEYSEQWSVKTNK